VKVHIISDMEGVAASGRSGARRRSTTRNALSPAFVFLG
jgi:hypothetical protein